VTFCSPSFRILYVGRQKFTGLVPKSGNVKWKPSILFFCYDDGSSATRIPLFVCHKLSPYLEKVSRGSHEMINTYSEVTFTK
jgi:hypothetical protein